MTSLRAPVSGCSGSCRSGVDNQQVSERWVPLLCQDPATAPHEAVRWPSTTPAMQMH
jgi:hypothetical protein